PSAPLPLSSGFSPAGCYPPLPPASPPRRCPGRRFLGCAGAPAPAWSRGAAGHRSAARRSIWTRRLGLSRGGGHWLSGAAARGTTRDRPKERTAVAVPSHRDRLLHEGTGRHDHHRYAEHLSLSRARQRQGGALRHWGRPRRLHLVWRGTDFRSGGMARLEPARTNDRAPALSAALHGWRRDQPTRGARALSRRHALPHPRYEPTVDH